MSTYPEFIKALSSTGAWVHCDEFTTILCHSNDDVTSAHISITHANVLPPIEKSEWLSKFDWSRISADAYEAAGRLGDFEIGALSDDFSPGFIYAISHPVGVCKIGFSVNPIKRREQISKDFGLDKNDLTVFGLIKTNTMRSSEACLHDLFSDRRIGGEWFALDRSRQSMISKMYRMHQSTIEYKYREDLIYGGVKRDEEIKKLMEAY